MEQIKRKFPSTVICRHEHNRGLGIALRTGFANATGDAILTLDADLTFPPSDGVAMIEAYDDGIDCVLGSPFEGKTEDVNPFRWVLSSIVNKIYSALLGANVTSASSIFRLYRASTLKSLSLQCQSFDINAEILFKILAGGGQVVEIPVTLGKRMHGVSKINVLREIKNHFKMFNLILQWKRKNRK